MGWKLCTKRNVNSFNVNRLDVKVTNQEGNKFLMFLSLKSAKWLIDLAIAFYLFLILQDKDILNLGTGSVSWFESHGPGCKAIYPANVTYDDPTRPIRPERVDGCYLDYHIVEVVQSGVQIFLAVSHKRLSFNHDSEY